MKPELSEFVETAFSHVGITIEWQGTGVDEIGMTRKQENACFG